MRLLGFLVAALLAGSASVEAWGFAAHRAINRQAVVTLPEPLASLFRGNVEFVAEHAIDPDLWRAEGRTDEDVAHFLDLDSFGAPPFGSMPRTEAEVHARYGVRARGWGRLPWRTAEVYRDLVDAFRSRDAARILERAAVLGHYVADAHVPFHATANHDGQRTGQEGVHSRWESGLFGRYGRRLTAHLDPGPARARTDAAGLSFESLIESYSGVAPALESDLVAAGECDAVERATGACYGAAYYAKLYAREGGEVRARLRAAAARLGDLWLGAWVEAGRPAVDRRFRLPRPTRPRPEDSAASLGRAFEQHRE